MSLPKPSLYNLPHRQNTIDSGSNSKIEAQKPQTKSCDMLSTHQRISNVEYSHGTSFHDPTLSTEVLHESETNTPAITVTTYKDELLTRQLLRRLLQRVEPSHDESICALRREALADTTAQVDEKSKKLIRELEEHFEGLKSEFETKTGRVWTPLRAWEDKEWNWEWEDEKAGDEE